MSSKRMSIIWAIVALLCAATASLADIKVKTKTTMSGQSYEGTTYIKKARQRTEQNMAGMSMVNIMQCDLKRSIQINDKTRTYLITPFGNASATAKDAASAPAKPAEPNSTATRRGGVITFTNHIVDTGERKQMFGMTARHLKITMTTDSSPDACNPTKMKMEIDGWYVDLEYGLDCQMGESGASMPVNPSRPDCMDQIRYKTTGSGKQGYPLLQTTVMFDESGKEISRVTTEVVELTTASLDPALFDIPAGYKEARSAQELYTGAISSAAAGDDEQESAARKPSIDDNRPSVSDSAAGMAAASAVAGTVSATTPKKAGAVRIGLVVPKTQMNETIPSTQAEQAVRNTFAGFLNGPTVEVLMLNARTPEQAIAEARQGQCDYILFTGLTQKKGGGMFGRVLGGVAGAAAGTIPYGGSAGEAAARTAVYTTATLAGSIKSKDELTLDYKLQSVAGASKQPSANTLKAKAKSDGEDVVTPLVEKAAQAVLAAIK